MKGEFVNFGLMLLENIAHGARLVDVRFTGDRSRIFGLDPQADGDVLTKFEEEIRQEVGQARQDAALWRRMEDSFSGLIQIERLTPVWTQKPAAEEIDIVAKAYLESSKQKRLREPAGRQRILEVMRDEFEKAGVLRFLHQIPAEPYTKTGDPFEFDFGYRVGDSFKLFHAVSMRASVDSAVMLAARYGTILPAMARITKTTPLLTAIVEAELDRNKPEVEFALQMMRESTIGVSKISDMAGIAKQAAQDLKV